MTRLLVRWIDSLGSAGWQQGDSARSEARGESLGCETIGFLLDETDEWLLLAMSRRVEADVISDTIQIPKVAVLEVLKLRTAGSS